MILIRRRRENGPTGKSSMPREVEISMDCDFLLFISTFDEIKISIVNLNEKSVNLNFKI